MPTECLRIATFVADRARGRAVPGDVEKHLASCADCRAAVAAATAVARSGDAVPDLWPRLRARLAAPVGDVVHLRRPALGWEAIAAIVVAAVVPLLAPEPGRLVALLVGIL